MKGLMRHKRKEVIEMSRNSDSPIVIVLSVKMGHTKDMLLILPKNK